MAIATIDPISFSQELVERVKRYGKEEADKIVRESSDRLRAALYAIVADAQIGVHSHLDGAVEFRLCIPITDKEVGSE